MNVSIPNPEDILRRGFERVKEERWAETIADREPSFHGYVNDLVTALEGYFSDPSWDSVLPVMREGIYLSDADGVQRVDPGQEPRVTDARCSMMFLRLCWLARLAAGIEVAKNGYNQESFSPLEVDLDGDAFEGWCEYLGEDS